jgi:hypothetical protein
MTFQILAAEFLQRFKNIRLNEKLKLKVETSSCCLHTVTA